MGIDRLGLVATAADGKVTLLDALSVQGHGDVVLREWSGQARSSLVQGHLADAVPFASPTTRFALGAASELTIDDFQAVAEAVSDAIIAADGSGSIVYANSAAARMFAMTRRRSSARR